MGCTRDHHYLQAVSVHPRHAIDFKPLSPIPAWQIVQPVLEPTSVVNWPGGQVVHEPAPALLAKVPAEQLVHGVVTPGENCPGLHALQFHEPDALLYCPSPHDATTKTTVYNTKAQLGSTLGHHCYRTSRTVGAHGKSRVACKASGRAWRAGRGCLERAITASVKRRGDTTDKEVV